METFVAQIVQLIGADPVGRRWIVVPSKAAGHNIAERLARDGNAWVNLRFTTTADLAWQIAGPVLVTRGIGRLDPSLGPAIILQLLVDLPRAVPRYFREIAAQPGVAEALWTAVTDLRMARVAAADAAPETFSWPEKGAEFRALFESYERYLVSSKAADPAAILDAATAGAGKYPVSREDEMLVAQNCCGSRLEREFLNSLPARVVPVRVAALPGIERPPLTVELDGPAEMMVPVAYAESDAARLDWIGKPTVGPPPVRDGSLQLFRSAGREAEIEEVLRRIHRLALPLDSVEIVCAQPGEYSALLWEKAARHDLPLTLDCGIPGTLTRPVRAALALCEWIESGYVSVRLIRMFESGTMRFEDADLTAGAAARLLRQARATAGRATYSRSLTALAASLDERAANPDTGAEERSSYSGRSRRARLLAEWIENLLASIPEESGGAVPLGRMISAVKAFLTNATSTGGAVDVDARAAALAALDELAPLEGLPGPLVFQIQLIRSRLLSIAAGASRPRPGALHVSVLGSPTYSGRPNIFVLGLEEGAVFPVSREDPVLLDSERAFITPRLASSRNEMARSVYASEAHLAGLRGSVTLSFSSRDLRQGRETYPSWIVFHAYQLLRPAASLRYDELIGFLNDPVTLAPREAVDALADADWWMAGLRGLGPVAMASVGSAFPYISRGIVAETRRRTTTLTEYDGLVPAAGGDLNPFRQDRVESASSLERFAECPFRYFLEKGVGVDPLDDEDPDPDVWLDPLDRGELLHRVYSRFLRRLRSENRRPNRSDREMLEGIAAELVEAARSTFPPPSEQVYEVEVRQLRRDLDLFLRLEMERDAVPLCIETPFGSGELDPEEPFSRRDPVEIGLGNGNTLRLRGRIDRVDRLPDGSLEIVDYKTGRLAQKYRGMFSAGTLLQHALYAEAARRLLAVSAIDATVRFSSYHFPTERGGGARIRKDAQAEFQPVVRDLAEAISAGAFVRGKDVKCQYCDFDRACLDGEQDCAKRKLSSGHSALSPLERVVAYE